MLCLSRKEDEGVASLDRAVDGGGEAREEHVVGDKAWGGEMAGADADDLLALEVRA